MKPNFAIAIPTINRADLLIPTLIEYRNQFVTIDICVLDNGHQDIPFDMDDVFVIKAESNLGVAESWNMMCRIIFKEYDYVLILNDDIRIGGNINDIQEIISLMDISDSGVCTSEQGWCAFILSKQTFIEVGDFDKIFFPAYFEDCDYHYRLNLAGSILSKSKSLNPIVYRQSSSIDKDASLNNSKENLKRYIAKWGGQPSLEKYTVPYNGYTKKV
jgi:GT2 family glycosyltransferase